MDERGLILVWRCLGCTKNWVNFALCNGVMMLRYNVSRTWRGCSEQYEFGRASGNAVWNGAGAGAGPPAARAIVALFVSLSTYIASLLNSFVGKSCCACRYL